MLHGPNPDMFRTKVHNARWYCDPLPGCDLAPATQDKWPSVTTIKKAWAKPFRKSLPTGERIPLDTFWAAQFTLDNLAAVNALAGDPAAAIALIASSPARTLHRHAERGTGVHTVVEDLGAGKPIDETMLDPAVHRFLPACRAFIADWAPLWLAAEFLVFNRTIGFAGTGDAIITVQRDGAPWTALVDWKSRGGEHGAYEEEIAQIGGYSLAEYIVVASPIDGRPVRMELPRLDGGLVVSLTKDDYQLYPVDLDEAQAAFRAMRVSWHEHREGQKAARRGRLNPLIATGTAATPGEVAPTPEPAPTSLPASLERLEWIRGRITVIRDSGCADELAVTWPPGTPTLKDVREQGLVLTDAHVDAIGHACDLVEKTHGLPFGDDDPLFASFGQDQGVALERAVTEARIPSPTAAEWKDRIVALLEPLGDEATRKAVVACVGTNLQASRQIHDRVQAVLDELLFSQDDGPNGAVSLQIADDGTQSIVVTADARDRMNAVHGNEIAALAVAKSHAKALGLAAPRSLKSVVEQPLLVALVAAGQQRP